MANDHYDYKRTMIKAGQSWSQYLMIVKNGGSMWMANGGWSPRMTNNNGEKNGNKRHSREIHWLSQPYLDLNQKPWLPGLNVTRRFMDLWILHAHPERENGSMPRVQPIRNRVVLSINSVLPRTLIIGGFPTIYDHFGGYHHLRTTPCVSFDPVLKSIQWTFEAMGCHVL